MNWACRCWSTYWRHEHCGLWKRWHYADITRPWYSTWENNTCSSRYLVWFIFIFQIKTVSSGIIQSYDRFSYQVLYGRTTIAFFMMRIHIYRIEICIRHRDTHTSPPHIHIHTNTHIYICIYIYIYKSKVNILKCCLCAGNSILLRHTNGCSCESVKLFETENISTWDIYMYIYDLTVPVVPDISSN